MKKRLAERMLNAELDHHLDSGFHSAPRFSFGRVKLK